MGTRADFYIKEGKKLEQKDWIGSIAWDGYPSGIDTAIKEARSSDDFKKAIAKLFKEREDVTLPEEGWPWPWDDSGTTDYAYVFNSKSSKVTWKRMEYPDMSGIKKVKFGGKGSGLIVIGGL
jgi:hypothetical protein